MNLVKHTKVLLVFGLFLTVFACKNLKEDAPLVKTYDSSVMLKWHTLYCELERYMPGFRPAPGPRALAYMGLSAYHACITGMPEYNSLENVLPGGLSVPDVESGAHYHWPTVVNASYDFLMKKFFASMANGPNATLYAKIDELHNQLNGQYQGEIDQATFDRSAAYGEKVASVVYEWSKTDNGHDSHLDPQPVSYVPPAGPGLWQPTYPNFARAMFPYYGASVRPFAMLQTDLICPPPIPYSEDPGSKFYGQASYVKSIVDNIKANGYGGYEDLWIGEFWSDDILNQTFGPPTRWIAITDQVVAQEEPSLDVAIEAYTKVSMSLSDYCIGAWKSKYYYNVERPVSYIRRLVDPNWVTALNDETNGSKPRGVTPPFPAYPSGHSGMGGAAGAALTDIFGVGYSMTDRCHEFRIEFNGKPRSFNSFDAMAWENAYSRVPLGVHFEMDCIAGIEQGRLAAKRVIELPWKK